MVSRFSWFHRILCVVLALVTVFFTLSPAIVQPADAVAVVDDMALAVGLLFATWSGITFPTTAAARKGITNFFNYNPTSYKVCSTVASDYVRDGKLALVEAVRDHYITTLYDIARFFHPADESSTTGTIVNGAVVGASYSVPHCPSGLSYDERIAWVKQHCTFLSSPDVKYSISVVNGSGKYTLISESTDSDLRFKSGSIYYSFIPLGTCFTPYFSDTHLFFPYLNDKTSAGISIPSTKLAGTSATITILSADEESEIPFTTTKEIDGSQIQEITFAPGGVWVPDPDDPTTPTDPDTSMWPGLSLGLLLSLLQKNGTDNPNLDPSESIKQLQQILDQWNNGTIDPTDPVGPGGSSGGSSGSGSAPGFDDMKLPGLKDFFPFCIPFDLYAMMQALCADPVAPSFTFATSFLGHVYTVDIDLSAWNDVATVVRYMVVAIYIVALAVATRKFIKW